ncbi:MAG: hypothetical protein IT531_00090 [Burkholderiales bacterium]|nr:hypothetical protein [Burkholderiales bacterium]
MAFTDDFTGTSGQDLEARTGWTLVSGSAGAAEINASNQLKTVGVGNAGHAYNASDCGTADHYAQCVYRGGLSGPWVPAVRVVDNQNFVGVRAEAAQFSAQKRVANTFSAIGTYAATPASGDVLKCEMSGTSFAFYLNGVSRITGTVSDAVFSGVTKCGLVCRSAAADPCIDDWESTTSGGGGPTEYLITPSGGVAFAGGATLIHGRVVHPAGGVGFSGAAPITRDRTIAASGGVVFDGAAPYETHNVERVIVPSGRVTFGGTAPMTFTPAGGANARAKILSMGTRTMRTDSRASMRREASA